MQDIPNIEFPPEAKKRAIELAAFDILKQLCDEGKITKEELCLIAEKHNICIV